MHLRSEHPPLCGRDHLSFRSYYFPVKVGLCWKYGLKRGIISPFNKIFSLVVSLPPLKNQNSPFLACMVHTVCQLLTQPVPWVARFFPSQDPLACRPHPSAWPWEVMDCWWCSGGWGAEYNPDSYRGMELAF